MKKILIFTDSRGQHIPAGYTHEIFPKRVQSEIKNVEVDLILCPMKWTTTLDFIDYSNKNDLSSYDYIILYTGIVEWSPRPQKSALEDLYANKNTINLENWDNNTKDYSKKIINNKKKIFDNFFGTKNINKYLKKPFDIKYENQKTINMYSLAMATKIGSFLSKFDNLFFINANNIVDGWEGNFKRGRPKNISIIHEYSSIVSGFFPPSRLINISQWTDNEIKVYTCDNMHLTNKGSDWVMEEIVKKLNLSKKTDWDIKKESIEKSMNLKIDSLLDFKNIETFRGVKKNKFISNYTNEKYLATLIIGLKLKDNDPSRIKNLKILLDWINYFYEDMFDVLIVEQDIDRKLDEEIIKQYSHVRYEFIYNNKDYNRGWGYNVAVKNFCSHSKVVALMDTDVLTGSNFVSEIRDCLIGKYDVISPYQNIYYTDLDEVEYIKEKYSFSTLKNEKNIKNPVTITGGIVIFNKKTYMDLNGFEQYIGYGCEDRSLDVMLLGLVSKEKIKISPVSYIHLYHPTDKLARNNFKEIYQHLKDNYFCEWSPRLNKFDFIHKYCSHISIEKLTSLLINKNINFGDVDLYKLEKNITVNGRIINESKDIRDVLLPTFKDFSYPKRELYDVPEADIGQLEKFRNAFLGKRCFIIGNGPSLNKHDLSLLENEYSFGVNSFYYKTKETGFRPTFYVVEDTSVMKENLKEIKEYHAPFKFFPTLYKRLHPKDPNTFFFTMNRGFYEKSSPNYCVPRFSTDASKELFCGQSVTYINLQLAYFMGFTEIHLIGMDFSYIIPDSHKRTGDVLLSDSDDENHFHKDYFGKGKTWKDPKLDRVGMNYRMAKLVFESTGRKIYNATVGGSLEIFDRIDYYSLFDKEKEHRVVLPEGNFSDANKLFTQKRYSDALVVYLKLVENDPDFVIYKQSLFNCYFKAQDSGQPIQAEIVNRIKRFI